VVPRRPGPLTAAPLPRPARRRAAFRKRTPGCCTKPKPTRAPTPPLCGEA